MPSEDRSILHNLITLDNMKESKESDSKPYLIGLVIFIVITTILLLIEWYITAFVVFMVYIGIHMLICLNDLYPPVTKKKQRHKHKGTSGNWYYEEWNGYTDPDDMPTDRCGNSQY